MLDVDTFFDPPAGDGAEALVDVVNESATGAGAGDAEVASERSDSVSKSRADVDMRFDGVRKSGGALARITRASSSRVVEPCGRGRWTGGGGGGRSKRVSTAHGFNPRRKNMTRATHREDGFRVQHKSFSGLDVASAWAQATTLQQQT